MDNMTYEQAKAKLEEAKAKFKLACDEHSVAWDALQEATPAEVVAEEEARLAEKEAQSTSELQLVFPTCVCQRALQWAVGYALCECGWRYGAQYDDSRIHHLIVYREEWKPSRYDVGKLTVEVTP